MIHSRVLYTEEIDDPDLAAEEIFAKAEDAGRLAGSIGGQNDV